MKRKTPGGIWALRGVSVALGLIVIVVIGTIAYSAYEVYTGVAGELSGGSHPITAGAVVQGSSAIVTLNITAPNRGVYPLNMTLTCDSPPSDVVCAPAGVVIPPGHEGLLSFKMTIVNVQAFEAASDHTVNGTVTISMEPFVSLSVGMDLGSIAMRGLGQ